MADSWDDMRRAKEEQFFAEQNKAALERMKTRKTASTRACPICSKPMEQQALMGVIIDVCPANDGVWLDSGELEEIVNAAQGGSKIEGESWFGSFFKNLYKK
ncbi:MAG: zf-TFIIB domain-containing protein [Deltaproteobacteria bacterium]|nr:zf-TFIIB domain-containing protein [Deltaproteobacteria bacterium]